MYVKLEIGGLRLANTHARKKLREVGGDFKTKVY